MGKTGRVAGFGVADTDLPWWYHFFWRKLKVQIGGGDRVVGEEEDGKRETTASSSIPVFFLL